MRLSYLWSGLFSGNAPGSVVEQLALLRVRQRRELLAEFDDLGAGRGFVQVVAKPVRAANQSSLVLNRPWSRRLNLYEHACGFAASLGENLRSLPLRVA